MQNGRFIMDIIVKKMSMKRTRHIYFLFTIDEYMQRLFENREQNVIIAIDCLLYMWNTNPTLEGRSNKRSVQQC